MLQIIAALCAMGGSTPVAATPLLQENDQAIAFYQQGVQAYTAGDFDGARARFEEARTLFQQDDRSNYEALALDAIARTDLTLGDYASAQTASRTAIKLYIQQQNPIGQASSYFALGVAYQSAGQNVKARAYLQIAAGKFKEAHIAGDKSAVEAWIDFTAGKLAVRPILPVPLSLPLKTSKMDTADLQQLIAFGYYLYTARQMTAAMEAFDRAMSIAEAEHDFVAKADLYGYKGLVNIAWGDYTQAFAAARESLKIYQCLDEPCGLAIALHNVGSIYYSTGDLDQAARYYKKSIRITAENDCRGNEFGLLNSMSALSYRLGKYEEALALIKKALELIDKEQKKLFAAKLYNNLGNAYRALGRYQEAVEAHKKALETSNTSVALTAWINLGNDYIGLEDFKQAFFYCESAASGFVNFGDWYHGAAALICAGKASERQGNMDWALRSYRQAISLRESMRSGAKKIESFQAHLASQELYAYQRIVYVLIAQNQGSEAFKYSEQARAQLLLAILGNQPINPKSGEDTALVKQEAQLRDTLSDLDRRLQEEWTKPAPQRDQARLDSLSAELDARRKEYEDILNELQLSNPEYASLTTPRPFTLEQAQSVLQEQAPEATLLSYFVGEKEISIFVISANSFHVKTVTLSRDELVSQTKALRNQMRASPLLTDVWQQPARILSDWLFDSVREFLPPADSKAPPHLIIIPHDVLHYVPYGVLPNGNMLWIDGYTLLYAPSVASLQFLLSKHPHQAASLLALANPDAPGAQHLSQVSDEVRSVASLFGARAVIGSEATESLFKNEAGKYDIIHIAAHSDYSADSPLFYAIILTGDLQEDGRLETHELFNLNLSQTDMVVLSACETHMGQRDDGDELVGLERAFMRAGASSLLTTLWPVDDVATSKLMQRFYTYLGTGKPKADALRLAQIETRADFPAPYYWAGFILVGNNEPLQEQTYSLGGLLENPYLSLIAAGIIVVLLLAIIFYRRRSRRIPTMR